MRSLALLLPLLASCAVVHHRAPVFPGPPPEVTIPEPELGESLEGECGEPHALAGGTVAPCTGLLLPRAEATLLYAEEDVLKQAREALEVCYAGRRADRGTCEAVVAERERQLQIARQAQLRAALVGAGVGAGGVVAVVLVVLLSR